MKLEKVVKSMEGLVSTGLTRIVYVVLDIRHQEILTNNKKCQYFSFFWDIVLKLFGGGPVINRGYPVKFLKKPLLSYLYFSFFSSTISMASLSAATSSVSVPLLAGNGAGQNKNTHTNAAVQLQLVLHI